jgi:hypothetical protein
MPITRVKTGLSEFSIPARELFMCVSESGNRYAGIALPQNPIIINETIFLRLSFDRFLIAIGKRQRKVINILSDPI